MKKNIHAAAYCLITIGVLIFAGCGNGKNREFNHLLLELAEDDHSISYKDWITIKDYLNTRKTEFSDMFDNDRLKTATVKEYITDFFANRRPSVSISFIGIADSRYMKVKFYLERSGSMIPYDSPKGDGKFKSAIVRMLNNLPNENNSNELFVVNSSINEYPNGVAKFLVDNNIFEATKGIGNPSYTDFATIFNNILNHTVNNEISILVTDMIYSTKNMHGVNPRKIFAEAEGMTNAVFKNRIKDKSILVIKMNSSYNGLYYPYNAPSGVHYDGQRPYYIIVAGNKECMDRLTHDNAYASFCKFNQLDGYENEYLFDTSGIYQPYYSLLLGHPDIQGRFQPEHGQGSQITSIGNIEQDRNTAVIRLVLAVDLSSMFIDQDYLANTRNYKIEAMDDIHIKQIKPIDSKLISPAEKKHIGTATHLFVLEAKEIRNKQDVKIKLLNRMPLWVEQSSSDDDTNVDNGRFPKTTFGLKYLLRGIYDSYQKNIEDEPYYFELKMKFDN